MHTTFSLITFTNLFYYCETNIISFDEVDFYNDFRSIVYYLVTNENKL